MPYQPSPNQVAGSRCRTAPPHTTLRPLDPPVPTTYFVSHYTKPSSLDISIHTAMPVIASPEHQGWVRVSPPRRKPQPSKEKQDAALRGPLAYFSCQPIPQKPPSKLPPCPKYDVDDDHHGGAKRRSDKHRVVSAPASPLITRHDDIPITTMRKRITIQKKRNTEADALHRQ